MADINRLIVNAGKGDNLAASFIAGSGARKRQTGQDLQNTAAQNKLDRQANVNRLLQQQAQGLTSQAPAETGITGTQSNPFAGLLTDQDKQQVELLVANQDVAGLQKLKSDVLKRGRETSKTEFDQETKLRKEFDAASKDFVKVRDAHTRVLKAAEDPSGAGDLALIFNFMKVLDPGSTVREGEFATAQNSAGIDQRLRSMYNQVVDGSRLGQEQRTDFVDRSGRLFAGQLENQKANEGRFKNLATRANIDPEDVVFEFRLPSGDTKQKPAGELTTKDFNEMDIDDLRDFVTNHPDAR